MLEQKKTNGLLKAPVAPPSNPQAPPERETIPDQKPVFVPQLPSIPKPGESPGRSRPITPSCPIEPKK